MRDLGLAVVGRGTDEREAASQPGIGVGKTISQAFSMGLLIRRQKLPSRIKERKTKMMAVHRAAQLDTLHRVTMALHALVSLGRLTHARRRRNLNERMHPRILIPSSMAVLRAAAGKLLPT
jgi:hypothetical protein